MSRAFPLIRPDPPGAAWFGQRVETLLTGLLAMFDTLRQRIGIRQQSVEIVIAEDVASVVRSLEGDVVGVEALHDFSLNGSAVLSRARRCFATPLTRMPS